MGGAKAVTLLTLSPVRRSAPPGLLARPGSAGRRSRVLPFAAFSGALPKLLYLGGPSQTDLGGDAAVASRCHTPAFVRLDRAGPLSEVRSN